ncbi:MAG: hypothetical protein KC457_31740 [Myxococcales bacterium]|nr:hypothetical protein [Myxococcales bacterium]
MSRTDLSPRSDAELQRIVDDLARRLEAGDAPIRPCWFVSQLTRPRTQSDETREGSPLETVATVGRAIPKVANWFWSRRQLIWSEIEAATRSSETGDAARLPSPLFVQIDRALDVAGQQLASL